MAPHVLDASFGERWHPVARSAYLQCYDQKLEEDRYEQQERQEHGGD